MGLTLLKFGIPTGPVAQASPQMSLWHPWVEEEGATLLSCGQLGDSVPWPIQCHQLLSLP